MKPKLVCDRHGLTRYDATVCGHILKAEGAALGFVENSSDPDNRQGWCYACELVYGQEQDKTARFRAFNQFALVCSTCYEGTTTLMPPARTRNAHPTRLSAPIEIERQADGEFDTWRFK